MAGKRDEVDLDEARRLAWMTPESRETALRKDEPNDAELEELKRRVARVCEELRERVSQAAVLPAGSPQRDEAVDALIRTVSGLDVELVGLSDGPDAARLVRFYLEAAPRLPLDVRRRTVVAFARSLFYDFDLGIAPELAGDAARAGDLDMALVVMRATGWDRPRVAARVGRDLAGLLASGTIVQRHLAALLLAHAPHPAAVPALRDALGPRDLGLRVNCLQALRQCDDGLRAEDVLRLLEDAVEHGGFWAREDDDPDDLCTEYEDALLDALARLRPPGAVEVLERMRKAPEFRLRSGLAEGFVLRGLALLAPDRVLARITGDLESDFAETRREGVDRAAALPDELSRPLLLAAADDAVEQVAARAREAWLDRFGTPCPVVRHVGPLDALLDAPRSAAFEARLQLAEGPVEGAAALALVLLAEAPSSEALVLLLHLSVNHPHLRRAGLPTGEHAWARALLGSFGATRVVKGLLHLLGRRGAAGVALYLLSDVVALKGVPRSLEARVRVAARAAIATERRAVVGLGLLGGTRPTASDWRLLWPLFLGVEGEGDPHRERPVSTLARRALAKIGRCPALNEAIGTALADPARSPGELAVLAELAMARRLRRTVPLLRRILQRYDGRSWHAYLRLGRALRDAGHFSDASIRALLRRPDQPLFGVAAWLEGPTHVRGAEPLLRRALRSRAREGSAAVEALFPLAVTGRLRHKDHGAFVGASLARAPEKTVLWFLESMRRSDGTVGLNAAILRLFASTDRATAEAAVRLLTLESDRRRERVFTAALPLVKHEELRAELRRLLGLEPRRESDWVEGPEFRSALDAGTDEETPDAPAAKRESWWDDWYDEEDDPLPPAGA